MKTSATLEKTSDGNVKMVIDIRFDVSHLSENHSLHIDIDLRDIGMELQDSTGDDYARMFYDFAIQYDKKDKRMMLACAKQFGVFCEQYGGGISLTAETCSDFYVYLSTRLHGNTPANYFKKFRMFTTWLVEHGYMCSDPSAGIRVHYCDYRPKDALTTQDIELLMQTECANKEVARAFLFSCFTGLRWSDVVRVSYDDIDISQHTMTVVQSKVAGHSSKALLHTYLNSSACTIVAQGKGTGMLFDLPSYQSAYKVIQRWSREAGIKKHVTFHCARHTFVSRLLSNGVDLKTAAMLAGHSSTRHTERYVHPEMGYLRACLQKIALM